MDRVRAAFQQAESKRDKGEFEEILNERVSLQEEAQRKYAALERAERKLTEQLREERAFFAQHELLRCLKSGRCAFTPYKLASAMAGLPEVGWRRSAKRCSRDKSSSEAGQIFWLFRLLCRAISESKAANTNLSEHVRRTLQTHKDRKDYRLINAKGGIGVTCGGPLRARPGARNDTQDRCPIESSANIRSTSNEKAQSSYFVRLVKRERLGVRRTPGLNWRRNLSEREVSRAR